MSMDPIRGVYETVDAAELILDHEFCDSLTRSYSGKGFIRSTS